MFSVEDVLSVLRVRPVTAAFQAAPERTDRASSQKWQGTVLTVPHMAGNGLDRSAHKYVEYILHSTGGN